MKIFKTLFCGILFFLISAYSSVHADIFMYIDESGVMHFTNTPTSNEYEYKIYIKERTAVSRNFHTTSKYDHFISDAAKQTGVDSRLLKAMIKAESDFDPRAVSHKGAMGLMQIMPATGDSIAANAGWPPAYTSEDLYRPKVSLTFGSHYLDSQRDYFDGQLYPALAAYNAGPGNASIWWDLSGGDPDLFLEIIRYEETRDYIRGIYEVFSIYRRLYDRTP